MNKLEDLIDLIETKNGAITSAIGVIEALSQPCVDGDTCDLKSNPAYHWRGCEITVAPLLDNLKFIRDAK